MNVRHAGRGGWSPLLATGVSVSVTALVLGLLVGTSATADDAVDPVASPTATAEPTAPSESTPTPEPTDSPAPTPADSPTPAPTPGDGTPGPDDEADTDKGDGSGLDAAGRQESMAILPSSTRIAAVEGSGRSVAASRSFYPDGAPTVYIASQEAAVTPLIAGSMAGLAGAPLLFVTPGAVPADTLAELRRLRPTTIVTVAASGELSAGVVSTLSDEAEVETFAVSSRYQASRAALLRAGRTYETVYLVDGATPLHLPPATTAAAAADAGVLLVDGAASGADRATLDALGAVGASRLVVVGDGGAISSSFAESAAAAGFAVRRVSGADVYALSTALAAESPTAPDRVLVVNDRVSTDAALASALGAAVGQPVVFNPYECVLPGAADYIADEGADVLAVGDTYWLSDAVAQNTSCTTATAAISTQLSTSLSAVAKLYQGQFSYTVRELGAVNVSASSRGTQLNEPASMMKLYAGWALLRLVDHGTYSLKTKLSSGFTMGDCLKAMIHASDNNCHTDIVHRIGISRINALLKSYGFTDTRYGSVKKGTSVLYAGNLTTTNDLATFLVKLDARKLRISQKHTDLLKELMRTQIFRSRIPSGLPPEAVAYDKPGALWVGSGLLQADSAIVVGPRASFVISIIGRYQPPRAALAAIARAAYEHFNGAIDKTRTYPAKQMETRREARIRTEPWGTVVRWLPSGTSLEVTDARWVWYKVRWGTRLLWIDSRSLRNRPAYL